MQTEGPFQGHVTHASHLTAIANRTCGQSPYFANRRHHFRLTTRVFTFPGLCSQHIAGVSHGWGMHAASVKPGLTNEDEVERLGAQGVVCGQEVHVELLGQGWGQDCRGHCQVCKPSWQRGNLCNRDTHCKGEPTGIKACKLRPGMIRHGALLH